jgi:hypothetical protein
MPEWKKSPPFGSALVNWATELVFSPSGAVCVAASGLLERRLESAAWPQCFAAALLLSSLAYSLRGYTTLRQAHLDHIAWMANPIILASIAWGSDSFPYAVVWVLVRIAVLSFGMCLSSPADPELLQSYEQSSPGNPPLNVLIVSDACPPKVRR